MGMGFWDKLKWGFREGRLDAEKAARRREVERLIEERETLNNRIRLLEEYIQELERQKG